MKREYARSQSWRKTKNADILKMYYKNNQCQPEDAAELPSNFDALDSQFD